ncbi:MAG: 3-hydroxyacyl-CoA dehydrogenase NAD-binding domain-containing protein [Candidatus Thermoplasmatota archaeon]|nr:3-hydroxyacyl-CoA dehydrogenase NAD-binding domain-containing protein [Candidatus Thermoplasmatota archaeon]
MDEIKKVVVIGSGIMGHGIAEVFALSGYSVILEDVIPESLSRARASIEKSLARMLASGKLDQGKKDRTMQLIGYSQNLAESARDADLIIEAVPEVMDLKRQVFEDVSKVAKQGAIIASNTSNISITELSKSVPDPARFVGLHFFNPPVLMKLVEVIRGESTSDEVFELMFKLSQEIGKKPIRVNRDRAGFVVNRISAPEGLFFSAVLDNGIARPEEVDAFAKSQGLPMGPYELMDYVGIDTVVHSMEYYSSTLSGEFTRFRTLKEKMDRNELGLKTGRGFYEWKDGKAVIPAATPTDKIQLLDIFAIDVNEAVRVIEEGIATPEDIETGVKLGLNRPFGPISVAQGLSNSEIKGKLEEIARNLGCDYFLPARSIQEGRLREVINSKPAPAEARSEGEKISHAQESNAVSTSPQHEGELIMVRREGPVTYLELNNGRLNLLNSQMLDELEEKIESFRKDRETRVIVFRGKSGVFSAGAELSQFFSGGIDFMETDRKGQRVFSALTELPQVTIAEISGYCFGGGFELALACDIRITSDVAEMGLPEVTRGLVPGWGGTQRLPKLIGGSRAAYMILTGERIKGARAMNIGIAWDSVPAESLSERVTSVATKIATEVAPTSVATAKTLIYKGIDTAITTGLDMEAISMGMLFGTEDIKEGVSAFLQKRKPEFKGR